MTTALIVTLATALGWFVVYRFPFSGSRQRARVGMVVGAAIGRSARFGFTLFATLWYLAFGFAAIVLQARLTGVSWEDLVGSPPVALTVGALLLSALGAVAWTGVSMGALQAVSPSLDIPATVMGVRWVRESLAVKQSARWLVPLCGAVVEEVFYRGTVLIGLMHNGFPFFAAAAFTTVLFTATQMGMTETWWQASVLALASIVVSVFGCLLVAGTSSVLPAVALHGSFAAFYSISSWTLNHDAASRNMISGAS